MSGNSGKSGLEPREKGYFSDSLNQNYKKTIERGPDVLQNLQVTLTRRRKTHRSSGARAVGIVIL